MNTVSPGTSPFAPATPPPEAARVERRSTPRDLSVYELYRRLRRVLVSLERPGDVEHLADRLLDALVESHETADGPRTAPLLGGRAYRRVEGVFELFAARGESGDVAIGHAVPASYPVIAEALERGWSLTRAGDSRYDAAIEAPFGARAFAVLALGATHEHLLAFTLREDVATDELAEVLATLRSLADLALRQRDLVNLMAEARVVQTSLLPLAAPVFPGFEIAFRSDPAAIVGGDFYDFRTPQPGTLALAIGDATGHGLPAALQARDAVVGLRMAAAHQLKLAKSFEELAGVLREGSNGRRFISVVAGELDSQGNLLYVNAGHPPPLVLRDGAVAGELVGTGPVMGLAPGGSYRRAVLRVEPGDLLLLYTDGITEARSPDGEELGVERMVAWLAARPDAAAADLVDHLFTRLAEFTGGVPAADDQTVVVVRREL